MGYDRKRWRKSGEAGYLFWKQRNTKGSKIPELFYPYLLTAFFSEGYNEHGGVELIRKSGESA